MQSHENKINFVAEPFVLGVCALFTLSILGWVLEYSRYGFDFTDESFYLVWMANPFNYSVSSTQFGFIYRPLYQFLDGNIAALRQINIAITFCLAWLLSNIFLTKTFAAHTLRSKQRLIVSAAFATTSLVVFDTWLLTPSYNSLTLQSFLLTATGLLLAENKTSCISISAWFLIGVGGWLAFMAKPTSAAALALCLGVYLLLARKTQLCFLAIPLVTAIALFIAGASAIDGAASGFIARLTEGVQAGKTIGGGHQIIQLLRLDNFILSGKTKTLLLVGSALFTSAIYLPQAKKNFLIHVSTVLSLSFTLIGLAIMAGIIQKPLGSSHSQGLLILSVPVAALLAAYALTKRQGFLQIPLDQKGLALAFSIFPNAYAFGTNNNYWNHGAGAAIFWVLAGLVALVPLASSHKILPLLLPIGLASQLVTVALIQGGIDNPYRQPQPLYDNDYKIEIGKPNATLIIPKEFGTYIASAKNTARIGGFKNETPIIDLTGRSPGLLYALNAYNIGQAWTIGGYPGSNTHAVAMLKKAGCRELASAWLLVEPGGSRKISPDVVLSFGANGDTDFTIVGEFVAPKGAGGSKVASMQKLMKPNRPLANAMDACLASRAAQL